MNENNKIVGQAKDLALIEFNYVATRKNGQPISLSFKLNLHDAEELELFRDILQAAEHDVQMVIDNPEINA